MTSRLTDRDVRPRGGPNRHLAVRLLLDVVVAVCLSLLVYGVLLGASRLVAGLWVLCSDDLLKKGDDLKASLQRFTQAYDLSAEDRWRYREWVDRHPDTSLELFDKNELIFRASHDTVPASTTSSFKGYREVQTEDVSQAPQEPAAAIWITSDGRELVALDELTLEDTRVLARIRYRAKGPLYRGFRKVSGVLAVLSCFVWIYLLQGRKVKELRRLTLAVMALGDRDASSRVMPRSHDELGILAAAIDRARLQALAKEQHWKETREREQELVRNMTHDLRTPLTALIGYLEILSSQPHLAPEDRQRYLEHAHAKAVQLRESSNEVFEHFLIETKQGRRPLILMDGNLFTAQWAELLAADLDALGFTLETSFTDEPFMIRIDQGMFDRILNNLLNNIAHCADPSSPCLFKTAILQPSKLDGVVGRVDRGPVPHAYVSLALCNEIAKRPNHRGSSGLGLENVRQIMEAHGGYLRISETRRQFCVRLILPLAQPDDEGV